MRTIMKRRDGGKWWPLVALPILLAVCFLLWLLLVPPALLPVQIRTSSPGFPGILVMGIYLGLSLVHLVLFFILKGFKANLLFSIAALIWMLLIGSQLYRIFPLLSPPDNVSIGSRLILLALPVMGILILGVIRKLFPDILQERFAAVVTVLMALCALLFLFFDEDFFELVTLLCMGVMCLAAVYIIIRLIVKLRNVQPEQVTFLIGAIILIQGAIYTFLLSGDELPSFVKYLNYNYMLFFSLFTSAALLIATSRGVLDANADAQRHIAQDIIVENQLDFQREQFGRLMENMESTRFMRHDMKHHLAVINEYVAEENLSGIKGYLEGMELGLSTSRGKFHCDNYAVNAIVNHYLGFAENEDAKAKVKLTVPADTGMVRDTDLCVIVGNFLENAVAACRTVPKGERFIRLFSYVQDDILTFTMENSFDGEIKEWDGVFYSTKRDGEGIGLSSVAAVAQKYGGAARFEAQGKVFLSSAYVDMGDF